jgi:hypothetical protein
VRILVGIQRRGSVPLRVVVGLRCPLKAAQNGIDKTATSGLSACQRGRFAEDSIISGIRAEYQFIGPSRSRIIRSFQRRPASSLLRPPKRIQQGSIADDAQNQIITCPRDSAWAEFVRQFGGGVASLFPAEEDFSARARLEQQGIFSFIIPLRTFSSGRNKSPADRPAVDEGAERHQVRAAG